MVICTGYGPRQNKANSRAKPGGTRGKLCKTNPIPRFRIEYGLAARRLLCGLPPGAVWAGRTNKPNSSIADWAQTCRLRPAPAVRNKPNFRPDRRPRYPTIPLFYYSTIQARCVSCETKPLPRLRLVDWAWTCGGAPPVACRLDLRGPVVQTDPIGRSESCKTKPIHTRVLRLKSERQACKTKPIAGSGATRRCLDCG
jgi:hypothetical protein